MKPFRFTQLAVLVLFSTMIFAQTETQKSDAQKSDAQKSFDTMKTLAGTWNAKLTVDPPMPNMPQGHAFADIDARDLPRKCTRP